MPDQSNPPVKPAKPPRLFHLLALARQNLFRSADRVFSEALDVSGTQVIALFAIGEQPGCQLRQLAQVLQLQNSAITGLVARMEENGLVTRQPCDSDGRASSLQLSARGAAVVEQAKPLLQAVNAQLLAGFSAAEIDTVARFLRHASSVELRAPAAPLP